MKNIVQLTHEDLLELIVLKLTGEGHHLLHEEFAVEFVTSADGLISALCTGVVQEPKVELVDVEQTVGVLRARVEKSLMCVLTFKPRTQKFLIYSVMVYLTEADGKVGSQAYKHFMKDPVAMLVEDTLQKWEKEGKVYEVAGHDPEDTSWLKRRGPDQARAAEDVLGGSGGVMDRSEGLAKGFDVLA